MQGENTPITNFVNVTISCSLSKDIQIEVPDNYNKDELKERLEKDLKTPDQIIQMMNTIFRQNHVMIGDVEGWELNEKTIIIDE